MRALTVSTLVLLAEHSQALDVRKAARNTRRLLPNADVGVPPDATRHTIPTVNADRLNQKILQFLALDVPRDDPGWTALPPRR